MKLGRPLLFAATALGLSVLVTTLLAELVVRFAIPQPVSWAAVYRRHPVLPIYALQPNVEHHLETGETSWTIYTDEHGFRFDPRLPVGGRCRVLWLGDSFVFGHGVDYPEAFVGLIDAADANIDHLDSGVPGYGPTQYRQTFEYWLEQGLAVDRVFVATYLGNDFHDTQWSKDSPVVDGLIDNRGGLDSWLKQHSHLRRLLANVYHALAPRDRFAFSQMSDDLANPEQWRGEFLTAAKATFEQELARIAALAAEQGIGLAVLILPTRDAVQRVRDARPASSAPGTLEREPLLPTQQAKAMLDRLGIDYVDVTDSLASEPVEDVFFRFDGHLTPLGNGLVRDALLAAIPPDCD